jgi:hypothetical protein
MKKIILLGGLLLASCGTQTQTIGGTTNEFDKYLASLDIEYVLYNEKCSSTTGGKYIESIRYDDVRIPVGCLLYYEIIPLETGYEDSKSFYIVVLNQEGYPRHFVTKKEIIDKNGKLVPYADYFGGK